MENFVYGFIVGVVICWLALWKYPFSCKRGSNDETQK